MRGAILLRAFQHPPEGLTGAGCTVVMYGGKVTTKVVRKEPPRCTRIRKRRRIKAKT
jgi:hypothetical protein